VHDLAHVFALAKTEFQAIPGVCDQGRGWFLHYRVKVTTVALRLWNLVEANHKRDRERMLAAFVRVQPDLELKSRQFLTEIWLTEDDFEPMHRRAQLGESVTELLKEYCQQHLDMNHADPRPRAVAELLEALALLIKSQHELLTDIRVHVATRRGLLTAAERELVLLDRRQHKPRVHRCLCRLLLLCLVLLVIVVCVVSITRWL
jgi:hypothetical protein